MRKLSKLVALFIIVSFAWTQTTGKLRGTVSSSDGQALAGANVIVDGTSMGAATDGDGGYTILNVPAGRYSVTASYIGYKSTTESNVVVKVNLTTPMDFSLESSAIEGEAITIVGRKRLIEPSATNSVRTVDSEEIQNAASRSVTGMLDMQAGVTITNGKLHIRGSRAEEVAYTLDGAQITDVINTGRDISAIPEALAEIAVEAGGYGAHVGGANSGVVRQTLRTGGNEFGGNVRFESGDYGYTDMTATIGGPLGPVRFFAALRQSHTDDWNPSFYESFDIDVDGDGAVDDLPSFESGVTPDGDTIQVSFDGSSIAHRQRDNMQLNTTASMDFGPLNLRFTGVMDNSSWQSNSLPIYYMFNTDRLAESERTLTMLATRVNFFLNPNFLLTAGFSTMNRSYESYDGLFGKPSGFQDALMWHDSASVATTMNADAGANWRTSYTDPTSYYVGLFPFQRPGDITTGWSKNNRTTLGIDAGMTYQMGDHEIRAGLDIKQYTYRKYYLSTSAMEQVNRLVATSDDVASFDDAASGSNETVTDALSLYLRGGQIGYDDYGAESDDGFDDLI